MALMEFVEEPVAARPADVAGFVTSLRFEAIPAAVVVHARRAILDLIGVIAAGSAMDSGRIANDVAVTYSGPGDKGARLMFDGRRTSVLAAAEATAAAVDSLDCHELHPLSGGHPAGTLLPALLALTDETAPSTGAEFLRRFIVGYEIAVRAGITFQRNVAQDLCSSSWNSIGTGALCAAALGLKRGQVRHALGASEYFAPRGNIRRSMDYPTMVKDGAVAGVRAAMTAALLAGKGFTGAPSLIVEEEEPELWASLGTDWLIAKHALNPLPVSRWAQPAVEAALKVRAQLAGRSIDSVVVETFDEASRLTLSEPETAEAAHYSIPFPVAQALVHGRVDPHFVVADLADPDVLAMAARIKLTCSPTLTKCFPALRCARLILVLDGTQMIETPVSEGRGTPEAPLSDTEIVEKFLGLAGPVIGRSQALAIAHQVASIERAESVGPLLELLTQPAKSAA